MYGADDDDHGERDVIDGLIEFLSRVATAVEPRWALYTLGCAVFVAITGNATGRGDWAGFSYTPKSLFTTSWQEMILEDDGNGCI